jgi:hypothetical protein
MYTGGLIHPSNIMTRIRNSNEMWTSALKVVAQGVKGVREES